MPELDFVDPFAKKEETLDFVDPFKKKEELKPVEPQGAIDLAPQRVQIPQGPTMPQITAEEESWPEVIGKSVMGGLGAIGTGFMGAGKAALEMLGEEAPAIDTLAKDVQEFWTPKVGESVAKKYASAIAQSTATSVPMMLTGPLALPLFGVTSGGNKYLQMREEGEGLKASLAGSAVVGASEALTEMLPLGVLRKIGTPFVKRLLKSAALELPGEEINTLVESVVDKLTLRPDMTTGDLYNDIVDTAIVTIGQTFLTTGMMHPLYKGEEEKQPKGAIDLKSKVIGGTPSPEEWAAFLKKKEEAIAGESMTPPPADTGATVPPDTGAGAGAISLDLGNEDMSKKVVEQKPLKDTLIDLIDRKTKGEILTPKEETFLKEKIQPIQEELSQTEEAIPLEAETEVETELAKPNLNKPIANYLAEWDKAKEAFRQKHEPAFAQIKELEKKRQEIKGNGSKQAKAEINKQIQAIQEPIEKEMQERQNAEITMVDEFRNQLYEAIKAKGVTDEDEIETIADDIAEAMSNTKMLEGYGIEWSKVTPQSLLDDIIAAKASKEAEAPKEAISLDEEAHEAATSPFNVLPEPTEAQIEAGNYKKGHIDIRGLDISIENPKGSERSGKTKEGKAWTNILKDHYGYIKGTVGKDKDHIDTFIGENPDSKRVFVVNQINPDTGKFDEHKVMLGYTSERDAKEAYLRNYEKNWQGLGSMVPMSMEEFKVWIKEGNTKAEAKTKEKEEAIPLEEEAKAEKAGKPTETKPEVEGRDYALYWNEKLKLGRRVDLVKKAKWITNKGGLSKLGEKIAESKWEKLSPVAQNILKEKIDALYKLEGVEVPEEVKEVPEKIMFDEIFEPIVIENILGVDVIRKTKDGKYVIWDTQPAIDRAITGIFHDSLENVAEEARSLIESRMEISGYEGEEEGEEIGLPEGFDEEINSRIKKEQKAKEKIPKEAEEAIPLEEEAKAEKAGKPTETKPEVPEAVKPEEKPKEPWQMTREEYAKQQVDILRKSKGEQIIQPGSESIYGRPISYAETAKYGAVEKRLKFEHKGIVKQALSEGKLTAEEYKRLHERDYGKLEVFMPDLVKEAKVTEPTERFALEPTEGKKPWEMTREEYAGIEPKKQAQPEGTKVFRVNYIIKGMEPPYPHGKTSKEVIANSKEEAISKIADKSPLSKPTVTELIGREVPKTKFDYEAQMRWEGKTQDHDVYIRRALSEGKVVPSEVLKDYPDLVKERFVLEPTEGKVDEKAGIKVPIKEKPEEKDYSVVNLSKIMKSAIDEGTELSRNNLLKYTAEKMGITTNEMLADKSFNKKAFEESYEYALIRKAREIKESDLSDDGKWDAIKDLYKKQINLTTRTSISIKGQQYSTPVPIAWLMGKWAGKGKMIDTTAGNGMLTIAYDTKDVTVNEIDETHRKQILEDSKFGEIFSENATKLLKNHPELKKSQDIVLLNPPFGKIFTKPIEGYKISKLEHEIVIKSLETMKDGGRAAIIIGGHNFEDTQGNERKMTEADRVFLNYLYSHFNVTHNIDINGEVYKKQGTTFPIRLLTIEGRKAEADKVFAPVDNSQVESAKTVDDIKKILEGVKEVQKLKSTDVAIKRHWEIKAERVDKAQGETEEQLKVILNETNRQSLLDIPMDEKATVRLPLYLDMIRNNTIPFTEWAGNQLGGTRRKWGENLSDAVVRAAKERPDHLKTIAKNYIGILGGLREQLEGVNNITDASKIYSELLKTDEDMRDISRHGYYGFRPDSYRTEYMIKHENEKPDDKPKSTNDRSAVSVKLEDIKREELPDYRNGKDVTGEDIKNTFGFASVTYGKYADAKERQLHTNHAFDAMHDLAKRLGIKPSVISLGGTLHLAIGALGHGRFSATYNHNYPHPSGGTVNVINLTKTRGDGTLAHEWAHALDYFLKKTGRFIDGLKYFIDKNSATKKTRSFLQGNIFYQGSRNATRENTMRWLRYQLGSDQDEDAMQNSRFYREALKLDKGKGKNRYWSKDTELFARAFEAYIYDTLEGTSPYLVNEFVSDGYVKPPQYKGMIYPSAEERGQFRQQFDELMDNIEWADTGPKIKEGAELTNDRALKEYRDHIQYLIDNIDMLEARAKQKEKELIPTEPEEKPSITEDKPEISLEGMTDADIDSTIDEIIAEEFPEAEIDRQLIEDTAIMEAGTESRIKLSILIKAEKALGNGEITKDKYNEIISKNKIYPPRIWNDFLSSEEAKNIRAKYKSKGTQLAKISERFKEIYPETYRILTERENITPVEDEPKLKAISKDFKDAGIEGINEALDGLYKLFGGGTIKSFPAGLDRESYDAAKPHFIKAYQATIRAGQSARDFVRLIVKSFGDRVKPYLSHFMKEVRDGKLDKELKSDIIAIKEAEGGIIGGRQTGRAGEGLPEAGQPSKLGELSERRGDIEPAVRPPEGAAQPGGIPGVEHEGRRAELTEGEGPVATEGERATGRVLRQEQSRLELQVPYKSKSKAESDLYLTPKNIAQSVTDTLDRIEKERGDIDQYVADTLNYDSIEKLHKAFSAGQIDDIAITLDNFDKGNATIIGNQTGTGKGRIVASIIRLANLQGLKSIFFTADPKLFTDMHRDLTDIGHDYKPFILHNDPGKATVFDDEGNIVFKPSVKPGLLSKMALDPHKEMEGYDVVFATYSQVQKMGNKQQEIIRQLAAGNIVILDESHLASGKSARGEFIRDVIASAKQVLYSSATYAKRPGTIPLYFRTALGSSGMDIDSLIGVMEAGGVPLQQVVASELAEAGQYVRKEMDFSGISFKVQVDVKNEARDIERADKTTASVRRILDFDHSLQTVIAKMDKEAEKEGKKLEGKKHTQAGITSASFASKVHNVIGQMLLALKVDTAADEAIRLLKEGKKPLINLSNTMETFMTYFTETGLNIGDPITGNFGGVLKKALDGTLEYTETDHHGNKTKKKIDLDETGLRNFYNKVIAEIDNTNIDLPASPIDYIKNKIEKAGYKVGEITGRGYYIDYSDKVPTLQRRSQKEQKDKNTPVNDFNSGRLDAIIFNSSGSTGLSLHASEKFKDQKPRHMIIVQADLNIDTFMQALGRIFRKGQVVNPEYTILQTALPAEIRPAAVLQKKMASLNANTSANAESATTLKEIPEMLNKHGDKVVKEFLEEHHDLLNLLTKNGTVPEEEAMRKVTGRVALLPVEQQKAFYEEVEGRYNDYIEYLNQIGENNLVSKDYDYKAETLEKTKIHQGDDESSPFTSSTYLEKTKVNILKKPFTSAKVKELVDKNLKDKGGQNYNTSLEYDVSQKVDVYLAGLKAKYKDADIIERRKEETQKSLENYRRFLGRFKIGHTYDVMATEDYSVRGVLIDIKYRASDEGNPVASSRLKFVFAVVDPIQQVTIPLTQSNQLYNTELIERGIDTAWDTLLPKESKEERYIITGNLLRGFEALNQSGEVITYTDKEGKHKTGILIPRSMKDVEDKFKKTSVNSDQAYQWVISQRNGADFKTTNGEVDMSFYPSQKILKVQVPRGKQTGGKYYLDDDILKLTEGREFISRGNVMSAEILQKNLKVFLDLLQSKLSQRFLIPKEEGQEGKERVAEEAVGYEGVKPGTYTYEALPGPAEGEGEAKVTALGIQEELKTKSTASLLGRRIKDAKELGEVAQIFRSARYETLRVLFVKNERVIATTALSSRLPNSVRYDLKFIEQLQLMAKGTNADGYYLVHNHPSGNPSPSREDINMTGTLATQIKGLISHVVIDDTQFATITPAENQTANVDLHILRRKALINPLKPTIYHSALGKLITQSNDLANLGQSYKTPEGMASVFYFDAKMKVRAIEEIPINWITSGKADEHIQSRQEKWGSTATAIVVDKQEPTMQKLVEHGLKGLMGKGTLLDAVINDKTQRTILSEKYGLMRTPEWVAERQEKYTMVEEEEFDLDKWQEKLLRKLGETTEGTHRFVDFSTSFAEEEKFNPEKVMAKVWENMTDEERVKANRLMMDEKGGLIQEAHAEYHKTNMEKAANPGAALKDKGFLKYLKGIGLIDKDLGQIESVYQNPFWLSQKYPGSGIDMALKRTEMREEIRSSLTAKFISKEFDDPENPNRKLPSIANSFVKLKGEELAKVEKALVEGDTKGKIFRSGELKGMGLSQQGIDSYKAVRALLDAVHERWLSKAEERLIQIYKGEKWYPILEAISRKELTDEDILDLSGKLKGVYKANVAGLKKAANKLKKAFEKSMTEKEKKRFSTDFAKAYEELRERVDEVKDALKEISPDLSEEELTKVTRGLIKAFIRTEPMRLHLKELRNQVGSIVGYLPRERERGKYVVKVIDTVLSEDEENPEPIKWTVYSRFYNYQWQGVKIEEELKKNPDYKYMEIQHSVNTQEADESFFNVSDINVQRIIDNAIDNIRETSDIADDTIDKFSKAVINSVADELKARGFGMHGIKRARHLIKGYKEAGLKDVILNYLHGYLGMETKQEAAMDYVDILKTIPKSKPQMFKETAHYIQSMLRNQNNLDRKLAKVRAFAYIYFLGGSLKLAAIQATQNFITGIPFLATEIGGNRFKGEAERRYLKATFDIASGKMNDTERRMINEMLEKGIAQDQYMRQIAAEAKGTMGKWTGNILKWLGTPFSYMEMFNRKSAALAMFRYQTEKGMDYYEAFNKAKEFIYKTHYLMSKSNLSHYERGGDPMSQGIRTSMTFRRFTHNYLLSMKHSLKGQDKMAFGTILHSLAYIAMFGGLAALPFLDDLLEMIEKMFGIPVRANTKKTMAKYGGETFARIGINGFPALIGMSITGSLATMLPTITAPEETVYGVYGGLAKKVKNSWESAQRNEYLRAIEFLSPIFIENALKAYRSASEGIKTPTGKILYDERGKPLKLGLGEATGQAMGFRPAKVAMAGEVHRSLENTINYFKDRRKELYDKYALAKPEDKHRVLEEMRAYNRSRIKYGKLVPPITIESIKASRGNKLRINKGEVIYMR